MRRATFLCAVFMELLGLTSAASAAYTMTIQQSGSNVVCTGSGTIKTGGLTLSSAGASLVAHLNSASGTVYLGATASALQGITVAGPATLGSSSSLSVNANSGTGDLVAVNAANHRILVPTGYVSGAALSSTAQYNNTTLSALHLTPGTYTYTWGSGANADSMTLNILSPASLSISATHGSPFFQAGPGTITLTVANTGGTTAGAATVSDTIDADLTINGVSAGCSVAGQTVTCTLASGASAASSVFTVYVTASAAAASSIANTATLSDSTDTIAAATSNDTLMVSPEAALADSQLTQIMLSGATDNGPCASGNMTLTATDQLQNTGGSTLANPYAVIASLTGGNSLLSQSVDTASLANNGTATFTFHIQLASCNTFQLLFDVRGN